MTARRRLLLFDFGGTLDADGVRWSVRFFDAYRRAGGALDHAAFEPVFRASDRLLAAAPGIRAAGLRTMLEVQSALLARLLPDLSSDRAGRVADAFHRAAIAAVDESRVLLDRLARANRLAVVSNFTGNLRACLDELDLSRRFEAVIDSGVVGVEKPDARIFLTALDALGARADEAWMIGDSVDADMRPAARLGMRTCWVAPEGHGAPADLVLTARVRRVADAEGLWG